MYDSASSNRFSVRTVRVGGTALLGTAEVEDAASLIGANVFWVDRRAVARRIQELPAVERAEVIPSLPGSVTIQVVERQPAALWISGTRTYVVDREGTILKALDGNQQPDLPGNLPRVVQPDAQELQPGMRVDVNALTASARLQVLLPQAGVTPRAFEWSQDVGLEVPTEQGWRVRFDGAGDMSEQVGALQTIRDYLARVKRPPVSVIDVRFADRPYFR